MSKLNDVSDGCIEVITAMKNLPLNRYQVFVKDEIGNF